MRAHVLVHATLQFELLDVRPTPVPHDHGWGGLLGQRRWHRDDKLALPDHSVGWDGHANAVLARAVQRGTHSSAAGRPAAEQQREQLERQQTAATERPPGGLSGAHGRCRLRYN